MWKPRLYYLMGCWLLTIGCLQLAPLFYAVLIGEKASFQSLFSSVLAIGLIGGSLFLGFRGTEKARVRKLTVLLPVFGITAMAVASGLPFFFLFPDEGALPALFEGMSLITTSGTSAYGTMLEDHDAIVLWRAMAAWAGGYLAICLALSIMSAMNIGGLQLHVSPMPFGDSEVGYARLKATTKALYPVYMMITAACAVLLWFAGAGSFMDCIQMAMATISTTGLTSTYGDALNHMGPQLIIAVFFMISIANWDLHYMRFKKRSFQAGYDYEYRLFLIGIVTAIILVVFIDGGFNAQFIWNSIFSIISAAATSGISPEGMLDKTSTPLTLAIILMIMASIGGATISTTGGLKQLRSLVIYKTGKAELERLAHPHAVAGLHFQGVNIRKNDVEAVWLLLGSFILVMAIGALVLAIFGVHFQDALSMAFSAMTLSGPLVSLTDPYFPGYAGLQNSDYITLCVLMLIGRIEASIFLALFSRALWRG
ncbi:TrkH family potassium uptake protein [Kordiimonas pumila]|uniref:TrkH family potassium uptake protein n=1 Tax=Kordiimonas pumila TaxID=2161677 RepID=A0ABV7D211_9PROT|nr:TrkH family potassium uptake protein [Kordiimonas pumila]